MLPDSPHLCSAAKDHEQQNSQGSEQCDRGEQTPAAAGVFRRNDSWEFSWDQQQTDIKA